LRGLHNDTPRNSNMVNVVKSRNDGVAYIYLISSSGGKYRADIIL